MKKAFLFIAFLLALTVTNAQRVISKTLLFHFTEGQLDSILTANGIPQGFVPTTYDVDIYKVVYNTVSYDSSSTIASGLLVIPTNLACKLPIASYQHGTIVRKADAPSSFLGSEPVIAAVLASNGYVGLEPDYIGLGDGLGKHIYQHAQSEATAVIDMIRAAREVCDSIGVKLNGQVFLTGYSQGGHATMAAHKMIQEKVDAEMHVTASCPMSGAYSMSEVMVNVMLSDSNYPSPSYLGYIITSWNTAYNMYDTLAKPCKYPYDSALAVWFNGNYGTSYVDGKMPSVPKNIFKPDTVLAFKNDPNHTFRLRLKDNDVDNWLPTSPVKMLFCSSDSYVSDSNAMVAVTKMRNLGCTMCDTLNVNSVLDHQECAQLAILAAKGFLDTYSAIDCTNGIAEQDLPQIEVYPNPSTDVIYLRNLPANAGLIQIFSADGKLVRTTGESNSLIVSGLAAGVYSIRVQLPQASQTLLFVKQ
ncbi:MAG: lipase family protein [Chitinophagales bacterium]